jgi:cytochrome c oxidase subunit II
MSFETESYGQPGAGASGSSTERPPSRTGPEPHHWRTMLTIWFVASLACDLIWWFVAGPHVPPGAMSTTARGAQFDFNVMFLAAAPVTLGVWIYMGHAVWMWRASRPGVPDPVGGPSARGNLKFQIWWIAATTVIVLAAFVFGTVELILPAGAGGGEGPNPIWTPTSKHILIVQVIAQQWKFTYRYPSFGGMETDTLVIPNDTTIAFHVTSLDVIHSFWAYQIGVKADANPQVDNVAYTTTRQTGTFTVRCSELCGIWHGAMYDYGKVLSKSAFENWALTTERKQADNTKYLPPFAWTYSPTANGTTGVTGTNTSTQAPFSKIEKYGATPAKKMVKSQVTATVTTGT